MSDEDEEVGYKRPPKRTRFRKGRSGNPGGQSRVIRSKTFVELIDEGLARRIWVTTEGKRRQRTVLEVIMQQLVDASANRDDAALGLYLALDAAAKKRGEKQQVIVEIIPDR